MAGVYAQSVEAAGDAEAEQASSSSGLFGEGWSAEMRVATWHMAFALTADSDFAYVFMSYEEGGQAVCASAPGAEASRAKAAGDTSQPT